MCGPPEYDGEDMNRFYELQEQRDRERRELEDRQREVNETSFTLGSVATDPQPAPQRNGWPGIARLVIEDLKHREAQGQLKYGMVLQPHNGRDPLIDAYQEAIDLAQYLRQAIFEKYRR
jgi:hypothetical protein